MKRSEKYETIDLYLGALLWMLLETTPRLEICEGWVWFVFPDSERLQKTIKDYTADTLQVSPARFASSVKTLRALMLRKLDQAKLKTLAAYNVRPTISDREGAINE